MRVLFTTTAGLGHIHPTVPLAHAMAARGHDVLWAVPPDGLDAVQATGIPTAAVGTAGLLDVGAVVSRFPEIQALPPEQRPEVIFGKVFGATSAPVVLADLAPLARSWRPDLVVSDAGEFAGHVVAAELGIPSVTKGFGPLLSETRVARAGREVEPLWLARGLEPRPYGGAYDHLYIDIFPTGLQPPAVDHVAHRQPMRPVTYTGPPTDSDPVAWPEVPTDAARVYVTMGTVFNRPELVEQVIDAVASLAVRVLATFGPQADVPALTGRSNVRVEAYVPQILVLPQADVVVSHGGSGTVVAALSHGLPQLCLPQGADQFLNARAVASAGAGLALMPEDANPEAIRDAVLRLTSDETFRIAAAHVSESIAAMPSPDEVAALLESLP